MSELWDRIKDHRAKVAALTGRDKQLYDLAHKISNALGFACQGAAQQNEAMEERYGRQAAEALGEFDKIILNL